MVLDQNNCIKNHVYQPLLRLEMQTHCNPYIKVLARLGWWPAIKQVESIGHTKKPIFKKILIRNIRLGLVPLVRWLVSRGGRSPLDGLHHGAGCCCGRGQGSSHPGGDSTPWSLYHGRHVVGSRWSSSALRLPVIVVVFM